MNILIWCWHTPYTYLLARALPEHMFLALPTTHAPQGWRLDQRPLPRNIGFADEMALRHFPADLVICQTRQDCSDARGYRLWGIPALFLSHNRVEYDTPMVEYLQRHVVTGSHWQLVCISEMKAQTWRSAGYSQPITVIPPGIPLDEYGGWTGDGGYVLTVVNHLRRPLFDLDAWLEATRDLPVRLVGEGNEGIPGAVGPAANWEELKYEYRRARLYLNPTCPPAEDSYNLASLEALATGCPVGNLHGRMPSADKFPFDLFARRWHDVLERIVRENSLTRELS